MSSIQSPRNSQTPLIPNPPPSPTDSETSAKDDRSDSIRSSVCISEYPDYNDGDIRKAPWKYSGYRVFSKWLASDQSFLIARRFGALQARVLLSLQDEIVKLEEELESMDQAYSRKAVPDVVDNGSFRNDPWKEREELIAKLGDKLRSYNGFINEYSQLMARQAPRPGDIRNVRNWLGTDYADPEKHPINEIEAAYITHTKDLISVLPKKISWFRKVLERSLVLRIHVLRSLFERKPRDIEDYDTIRAIEDGEHGVIRKTRWQNDKRVDRLSEGLIALVGLGMLIAPLWVLEKIDHGLPNAKLAAITVFIVVFFVLVAVATTARVFDALAATAAYSAVLMVFLQLSG